MEGQAWEGCRKGVHKAMVGGGGEGLQERDGWREGLGGRGLCLLLRKLPGGSGAPGEAHSACLCSSVHRPEGQQQCSTAHTLKLVLPDACLPAQAVFASSDCQMRVPSSQASRSYLRVTCRAARTYLYTSRHQHIWDSIRPL